MASTTEPIIASTNEPIIASTPEPINTSTTEPVVASTIDKTRGLVYHKIIGKVTVSIFDQNNVATNEQKRPEIVLLTVGRSGNGKTSLINSIVGLSKNACAGRDDAFKSTTNSSACLNVVIADDVNGVDLAVCDGISIDEESPTDTKDLLENIETFFKCCNEGFTAILIVLKYGVRFTKQEKDAISLIKYLFGEGCIRDYGIIVFTYGDNFDLDYEGDDTHKQFSYWCQQQRGDIQDLFREVNNRCVLFNNKVKDIRKSEIQQLILVEKITSLQLREPYTIEMYCKHLVKTVQQEFENLNALVGNDNFKSSCDELLKKLVSAKEFLKENFETGSALNLPVDGMLKTIIELKKSDATTKAKTKVTTVTRRSPFVQRSLFGSKKSK